MGRGDRVLHIKRRGHPVLKKYQNFSLLSRGVCLSLAAQVSAMQPGHFHTSLVNTSEPDAAAAAVGFHLGGRWRGKIPSQGLEVHCSKHFLCPEELNCGTMSRDDLYQDELLAPPRAQLPPACFMVTKEFLLTAPSFLLMDSSRNLFPSSLQAFSSYPRMNGTSMWDKKGYQSRGKEVCKSSSVINPATQ